VGVRKFEVVRKDGSAGVPVDKPVSGPDAGVGSESSDASGSSGSTDPSPAIDAGVAPAD
jgi:hypothetical protein